MTTLITLDRFLGNRPNVELPEFRPFEFLLEPGGEDYVGDNSYDSWLAATRMRAVSE